MIVRGPFHSGVSIPLATIAHMEPTDLMPQRTKAQGNKLINSYYKVGCKHEHFPRNSPYNEDIILSYEEDSLINDPYTAKFSNAPLPMS